MNIDDRDFRRLKEYMHDNFGINLEKKRTLIEGRLTNTILQSEYEGFTDYIDDVIADKSGDKVNELITKLTTNYTYFMREEAHYNFMSGVALPEWTRKIKDKDLRVWSAGCSSGEEAYTAAMVINEFFASSKAGWDTTILATDISPRVLAAAKEAVYPEERLERLPAAWRKKYFTKIDGDGWRIEPRLAKEVVFGQLNLMGSFARFRKKFHIIFCRNVMIYFDTPTKATLVKKFYDALEPGGYLFIGMSETLSGIQGDFVQISPAIYQKRD